MEPRINPAASEVSRRSIRRIEYLQERKNWLISGDTTAGSVPTRPIVELVCFVQEIARGARPACAGVRACHTRATNQAHPRHGGGCRFARSGTASPATARSPGRVRPPLFAEHA